VRERDDSSVIHKSMCLRYQPSSVIHKSMSLKYQPSSEQTFAFRRDGILARSAAGKREVGARSSWEAADLLLLYYSQA